MSRRTEQRDAIRRAIAQAHGPLSANEVLSAAQEDVPGLGIATVYRNLKSLLDDGYVVTVDLPGEPSRYERAGKDHHHHFECRDCGRIYDIPGCDAGVVHRLPQGFTVDDHEVLLFGRCAECAAHAPSRAPASAHQ